MINLKDLIDDLVTELQKVPDLVSAMRGDVSKIYAYHPYPPESSSVKDAIEEMESPSILVYWEGSSANIGTEPWRHDVVIAIRAPQDATTEQDPIGFYEIAEQLWNGKAGSGALPIKHLTINENCLPMNPPVIRRMTDAQGVDYFEFATSFDEIGDN